MTRFLQFQSGLKAIFTTETVAQQKSPIFDKQVITILMGNFVLLPLSFLALKSRRRVKAFF